MLRPPDAQATEPTRPPLRVAMVGLTGGGMSGGFRKYLKRMVPLLRADSRCEELEVYLPSGTIERLREEGLEGLRPLPRSRREWRNLRADVAFVPTARALERFPGRQVVMVRNMEPLEQPVAGLTPRGALTNLARALVARRACRRAARVIAVSDHVSGFLAGRWRVPERKLRVVRHGVDAPPADPGIPPALLEESPAFLFTAGSLRPARGLEDLAGALSRLGAAAPAVVVAGAADPDTRGYDSALRASLARHGMAERVRWAGWLSEAEMRWCFRHAQAFVMTSRAEACPNTALEAMSHGCVVVSTDRPPMPEFFGEAARYYRAGDAADLARQLAWLMAVDAQQKTGLGSAARARSLAFSWTDTARRTLDVLEEAAAG